MRMIQKLKSQMDNERQTTEPEDRNIAESTDCTSTNTTSLSNQPSKSLAVVNHTKSDNSSTTRSEPNKIVEKVKRKTAMATKNSNSSKYNSCYLEKETEMIKTYVHTDGFQVCTSVIKKTSTIEEKESSNQNSKTETAGSATKVDESSQLDYNREQCIPKPSHSIIENQSNWIDNVGEHCNNSQLALSNANDFAWPKSTKLEDGVVHGRSSHGNGRNKNTAAQSNRCSKVGSVGGSTKHLTARCSKAGPKKSGLRNITSSSECSSTSSFKPLNNVLLSLHSVNSTSGSSCSPNPSTHTSCGPSTCQFVTSESSVGGNYVSSLAPDAGSSAVVDLGEPSNFPHDQICPQQWLRSEPPGLQSTLSKRDCSSSTMSSIYTICETGSFQRDEKMEQDASVQSSSDIHIQQQLPLMEAIIDCSSDTINSFLNGCIPKTRSKSLPKEMSPRKSSDGNKNLHPSQVFRSPEESGTETEGIKVRSSKPRMAATASQELEWTVHSGKESMSFPDLVGVWSSPPSIAKSFSHSSCLLSCRRENQCELAPSHSSTGVENIPKDLSDTTLAIRKRLNLLSIIASANESRGEDLDPGIFTHSNKYTHIETLLCELSESSRGGSGSRNSGQGSDMTSETSTLKDKSLSFIFPKQQATDKTSSTNSYSKGPVGGVWCALQEEPSPASMENDQKKRSCIKVNKMTNTSPRETQMHSDTTLFLARTPAANRIRTTTKERKVHYVKKQNGSNKISSLNRSPASSDERRDLKAEDVANPISGQFPESEASAERVHKDLRANSSGRVKTKHHHMKNSMLKWKFLSFIKKGTQDMK